ncbi:hypothetical protein C2S52_008427 [Perilla frutescens var. hirtella]|nr:hypothetical protein C2S52_008427 [Perilla frutescens var. hirtella]
MEKKHVSEDLLGVVEVFGSLRNCVTWKVGLWCFAWIAGGVAQQQQESPGSHNRKRQENQPTITPYCPNEQNVTSTLEGSCYSTKLTNEDGSDKIDTTKKLWLFRCNIDSTNIVNFMIFKQLIIICKIECSLHAPQTRLECITIITCARFAANKMSYEATSSYLSTNPTQ